MLLHAEALGKTYGTVVKTVALSEVDFEMQSGEFASAAYCARHPEDARCTAA